MDRRLRRKLMDRLAADARLIAGHFALEYRALEPERANVKSRYGICYEDGTIRIRLAHAQSGCPLKYSSLVSTLCHELAHLRHFNHGPKFRMFYREVLDWARLRGIYRPGTAASEVSPYALPHPLPQPGLREALPAGRPPTLRESLRGVLPQRPDADTRAPARATPREAMPTRQLELFTGSELVCGSVRSEGWGAQAS